MRRRITHLSLVIVAAIAACDRHPRNGPKKEPPPAPTSEDVIHVGPLSGKIDGSAFQVKSARYYVDTRPGYEKVDIKLYGVASKTPCGELESPKPPSVWLRRVGPGKLNAEKSTTTVKDGGTWQVHYQVQDDGFWLGNGEANALVVLNEPTSDMRLGGVLSACFRDETGSCVAGEFEATFCRLSIDEPVRGTEAMERPPKKPLPSPSTITSTAPAIAPSSSVVPAAMTVTGAVKEPK